MMKAPRTRRTACSGLSLFTLSWQAGRFNNSDHKFKASRLLPGPVQIKPFPSYTLHLS